MLLVSAFAVGCGGQGAGPHGRQSAAPRSTSRARPPPATIQRPARPARPTGPGGGRQGRAGLPRRLLGVEVERLPTSRTLVALTFDAGANADGVRAIVSTLRRERVGATFFMTGSWAGSYPALARQIAATYLVGNHTYDHPHLTRLSNRGVGDEVARARRAIRRATGRPSSPFFRFPYGDSDSRTIRIVNALRYSAIRWTIDTLGWEGTAGGQSVAGVVARTLGGVDPGAIVLMHVGSAPDHSTLDAHALPEIIRALKRRGYRFVTLGWLLRGRLGTGHR